MCYFDHIRWSCGYWKWGNFRQQCTKEYRTGETCGLKLVYDTDYLPNQCRICDNVHKKTRRYYKMAADVERWRHEGGRTATIEKTEDDMDELSRQIANLNAEHATRWWKQSGSKESGAGIIDSDDRENRGYLKR